jgi:hypothetical protein
MNVRPKQGEACGKKTVLNETKLEREGSPLVPGNSAPSPAPTKKAAEQRPPAEPRPEQPPAPVPAPAPDPQPELTQDSAEQPEVKEETADEEKETGRRFPKYSPEQYQRLIELVEGGMTCPQAAIEVGIQVNTAYGIIGKYRRSQKIQGSATPSRRTVLSLLPHRSGGTTTVARLDAPFRTSTLMSQLKAEGIGTPGRMLNSTDLQDFFKLSVEAQENLRMFHAMKAEVGEADRCSDDSSG